MCSNLSVTLHSTETYATVVRFHPDGTPIHEHEATRVETAGTLKLRFCILFLFIDFVLPILYIFLFTSSIDVYPTLQVLLLSMLFVLATALAYRDPGFGYQLPFQSRGMLWQIFFCNISSPVTVIGANSVSLSLRK